MTFRLLVSFDVQVAEEDVNLDGKADVLGLSIKMPLERNFHVLLVKLLLLFDCKVKVG